MTKEPSKQLCENCTTCVYSKLNGMNLICTEWQEEIQDIDCLCTCYERKEDDEGIK